MNKCDDCKWWSDTMAQAIGHGPLEAVCLNSDNEKDFGNYVYKGCEHWEEGQPVDMKG